MREKNKTTEDRSSYSIIDAGIYFVSGLTGGVTGFRFGKEVVERIVTYITRQDADPYLWSTLFGAIGVGAGIVYGPRIIAGLSRRIRRL